jgi:hypothetical protein
MGFIDRLYHGWNAFRDLPQDDYRAGYSNFSAAYGPAPQRSRPTIANERSIIGSIFTRIGIDVASVRIRHIKQDENERFVETVKSGLNYCLNDEANIDQAGTAFRMDAALTLFDKGVIAIVPVVTDGSPLDGSYDIKELRIGEITSWHARHVGVSVYDDEVGQRKTLFLPKKAVAIVENPLYTVMNEPNSTLQRLIRKLSLLDTIDENNGSGKLDMVIQLPFSVKGETKTALAESRRRDLESQLNNSKLGVGYLDINEKITQLNRPVENNMLKQVEYLTNMLYGQLGLTPSVFDGTATELEMINYHNRTIAPILDAITEGMRRVFLTKTARTQGHTIAYFRDPFKLVPMEKAAEMADKFTRNEIMSSNEWRQILGLRPDKNPKSDELVNSNMPYPATGQPAIEGGGPAAVEAGGEDEIFEKTLQELEQTVDSLLTGSS